MILVKPQMSELITGFVPSIENNLALYIAIGIIGATVMPHNLYLHSALVQTRKIKKTTKGIFEAIKFNVIDSIIALNLAFFVNAAILVLAAATFYKIGMFQVEEIQDAYRLLEPLLGTRLAPILFAVALIAAGQSSTITGTLAGQIVMEGYLNIRIQPWLRRLITRFLAIIPAFLTIMIMGESETGALLVLSQVILSMQLGFAVIPLIHFVSDKKRMGEFTIKTWIKALSWLSALVIVALNIKLVFEEINSWIILAGDNSIWIWLSAVPIAVFSFFILAYITVSPLLKKKVTEKVKLPHGRPKELIDLTSPLYERIAVAVDFSDTDADTIKNAIAQGGKNAEYILIHIVETAGARIFGKEINDFETGADEQYIKEYADRLKREGYNVIWQLGYGTPKKSIPEVVKNHNVDLLVMGAHGHKLVKDILFGTTVDAVRHKVKIPILVVRKFELE
ncbi:MAG TPA: iron/manganese transporter, partial [Ignavibacteria bacterium]|nr:iron/manganese transporter [Ignavibacteria bacterium]